MAAVAVPTQRTTATLAVVHGQTRLLRPAFASLARSEGGDASQVDADGDVQQVIVAEDADIPSSMLKPRGCLRAPFLAGKRKRRRNVVRSDDSEGASEERNSQRLPLEPLRKHQRQSPPRQVLHNRLVVDGCLLTESVPPPDATEMDHASVPKVATEPQSEQPSSSSAFSMTTSVPRRIPDAALFAVVTDGDVDFSACQDADFALALRMQEEESFHEEKRRSAADAAAEARMLCGICLEHWPVESIFFVPCPAGHFFCLDCMYRHIRTEVLDRGRRPRCPKAALLHGDRNLGGGGDGDVLGEEVARTVASEHLQSNACDFVFAQPDVEDAIQSAIDSVERQREARRVVDVLGALDLPVATSNSGCLRCPGCAGWLERPTDASATSRRHVQCPECGCSFCAGCERRPYHFRTECDDVPGILERFVWWRREGREIYLREAAEQEEVLEAERQRDDEQRAWHQQRAMQVERRFHEDLRDERWKAAHCRHCPNCNRTIQRQGGCDQMICGAHGHGGSVQHGCGHEFRWSRAKRYTAKKESRSELDPALRKLAAAVRSCRPSRDRSAAAALIWPGIYGEPLTCDSCGGVVRGPRFVCINCPNFISCVHCEAAAAAGCCRTHPEAGHIFDFQIEPPQPEPAEFLPKQGGTIAPIEAEVANEKGDDGDGAATSSCSNRHRHECVGD
eukprot:TRINITY_DN68212_c0_g1_i1.p1 TRINITY_DN68212_c0_g1~~TRINITY_DN68212_c0_g1_i1.p1  ORF type:complete len:772 (-),score=133.45 TRINITY_DN68212_c0_g1_i1:73-2109(-)